MNHSLMKRLLTSDEFLTVSKSMIRVFGLNSAVFLSDLISKNIYFENRQMDKDGWFFNTEANRQEDTGLSHNQQRTCIKELVELEVLEVKRMGIPAKQHFKIDYDKLEELLEEKTKNKSSKNQELVIEKVEDLTSKNQELYNKNKEIRIRNKNKKEKKSSSSWNESLSESFPKSTTLPKRFEEFLQYRSQQGSPLKSQIGITRLINKLAKESKGSAKTACLMLEQSMEQGWTGVFPIKSKTQQKSGHRPYQDKMSQKEREERYKPDVVISSKDFREGNY